MVLPRLLDRRRGPWPISRRRLASARAAASRVSWCCWHALHDGNEVRAAQWTARAVEETRRAAHLGALALRLHDRGL